jgi:hypothetical protein
MDLKKIGWEGVDWIHMAQDKNNAYTLLPNHDVMIL